MKKLIALLLLAFSLAPAAFATSPAPGASFTHFHDYNPRTQSYSAKSHSHLGHVQSAELLVNGTTGLCWSLNPTRADLLVEQMIDVYNSDPAHEGAELTLTQFAVIENADPARITLRFTIGQRTPEGVAQIEWARVRRCR